MKHVVPVSEALQPVGLPLAVLSSKFLETNNKVAKGFMRKLPGGGRRRGGSWAHLPLVQGLKRCTIASAVAREQLYKLAADDTAVVEYVGGN